MVEVIGGRDSPGSWLSNRLGGATPGDGSKRINEFLRPNATAVTNPVKTEHSIFQKGTQGERS